MSFSKLFSGVFYGASPTYVEAVAESVSTGMAYVEVVDTPEFTLVLGEHILDGSRESALNVRLLPFDGHSSGPSAPLPYSMDDPYTYTFERWLRLEWDNDVADPRFWVTPGSPDSVELFYGIAAEYDEPTNNASEVAVTPVPTSEPAASNLGGDWLVTDEYRWLVIQGRIDRNALAAVLTYDLNVRWEEL